MYPQLRLYRIHTVRNNAAADSASSAAGEFGVAQVTGGTFTVSSLGGLGDHFHIEEGGPEGSIVHLHMLAIDGLIWEVIGDDGVVVATATLDDFERVLDFQNGRTQTLELRKGSNL